MGASGIIISRRGRHGLGSHKGVKVDIQSWELCKLGVTFKDVSISVISKLKYILCRRLTWLPIDTSHLFLSSNGIHANYHFRPIQDHSDAEKSMKPNTHVE